MTAPGSANTETTPPSWWPAVATLRADPKDQAAWRQLVGAVWPMLVIAATRSLGHRHASLNAEDAASDALAYVAKNWPPKALDTPDDFVRFLRWLVRRRVVDQVRLANRVAFTDPHVLAQTKDSVTTETKTGLEEFRELFSDDDLDSRIVDLLVDGWTQAEAAAKLGVHASTISRRVDRLQDLWDVWRSRTG